ncbi:MAG: universal stress protein [Nocardiaceae bacterium]|nr:universal stress protein [Nocardiaceae bacterium]
MAAYSEVLIATDGSKSADNAVAIGSRIAYRLGIPAIIITAYKNADGKANAEAVTQSCAASATSDYKVSNVSTIEREGNPFDVIVDIAEEHPTALLVVGSRGLGNPAQRLFGSVSNALSHSSPIDILFAHQNPQAFGAVGLTTDGSDTSVVAVRKGYEVGNALKGNCFLVTAAKDRASGEAILDKVESQLRTADPSIEVLRDVLSGVGPAEALVNAAWKYDLMVMGNRGMSGFARMMGSVANRVVHNGDANLLLIKTVDK